MYKIFFALIFILCSVVSLFAQTKNIDSLKLVLKNSENDNKAEILLQLSYETRGDSAISNDYARKALYEAYNFNQVNQSATALFYLGENAYYDANYLKAIDYYTGSLKAYIEIENNLFIYNCYNSIGLCYYYMFQGDNAIDNFIKALKFCENDKERTAEINSNIGMTHDKMQNYSEAISFYKEALKLNVEINDFPSIGVVYNGLGSIYSSMGKNDSSIICYNKALYYFKKTKNIGRQAIALNNIANIFPNYPDSLQKAISYFKQAWEIFKENGWEKYEVDILHGLGNVYFKQGKYKEAIVSLNKSLELTNKFNRGFFMKKINYESLSEVYSEIGDYKKALHYFKLYSTYTDSLVQHEKFERIMQLEKQYETEKKENEIIKLNAEKEITNIQLEKNKQQKILVFVIAGLFLCFLIFVLIKYYEKLKSNRILAEKNRIIEISEQELKILNASKNKFFSIIAHDLKNPLHSVMGYSSLLDKDYGNFSDTERRKFASGINQSINNIYRLLQNLLEWSKSQTGKLNYSPLSIKIRRLIESSIEVHADLAKQKKITINYDSKEEQIIFADPLMIETVIRNLISNAIKFTPENGQITVITKLTQKGLMVSVKDNGLGINESDLNHLFKIDSKVKRKGTNNEDGSGLGLILCKEFVEKNYGEIWAESKPGVGSSFHFIVPVSPVDF